MKAESERYLESISEQQRWRGDEPAFQLLWYPSSSTPPLPQYSSAPHFFKSYALSFVLGKLPRRGHGTALA